MIKVSIIIPSYNQQLYLNDAIDSALDQTIPCEVIVVDDGSTDVSLKIAQNYGKKIKLISQVNKGLSSARNTGIMNAKGRYILPLDADDILLPNAVEKMLEAIEKEKVDIVASSFRTFGLANSEIILSEGLIIENFARANYIGYFSMIRKAKLLEIGGYSPRMTFGYEDWHMWINLLARGAKLYTMKDVLVLYRTKEHSMIHESNKHKDELIEQIQKDFPSLYEKNS